MPAVSTHVGRSDLLAPLCFLRVARLAECLQVRPVKECGAVAVVLDDMVDLELGDDPAAGGAGVRLFGDDLAAQAAPGG